MRSLSLCCRLGHGGKQSPRLSFCLSYSTVPHVNPASVSCHQRFMYRCMTGTTRACHTTATVLERSWKARGAFCSGPTPGPVSYHPFPLFDEPSSQLSMASFHRVPKDKGLSQASHPHAAVSKATMEELGNRPWLPDRGCPACPRTELVLIPQRHERTACSLTEHERTERRACTAPFTGAPSKRHCADGVNEDAVWVNRQTLTSQRRAENGAVSWQGAAFPPSSVTQ